MKNIVKLTAALTAGWIIGGAAVIGWAMRDTYTNMKREH